MIDGGRLGLGPVDQVAYVVEDLERFGPSVAFAYAEAPKALGGSLIELLEMP